MAGVTAIVQARAGSTRLPGKVLADIGGRTLLERVITRTNAASSVDLTVVATTTLPEDDAVADEAGRVGAYVFRGSVDDVLDRFHGAAELVDAEVVVRITADDPFKEPQLIDEAVAALRAHPRLAYVSNALEPSYPEGLDIECFTRAALDSAWRDATRPSEREHVTPFLIAHPDRFPARSLVGPTDLSFLRWTIDHPDDLELARAVYAALAPDELFGMEKILSLLEQRPELREINGGHQRNEGYTASVQKELSALETRERA
jgi:spore coat polysaccharide biosynthesis protein SpsF